eukprot:m.27663 g.27663  ORF g.27663 m.27663 type:complete len:187 (+) comp8954_c0_seq3:31-591(+)
MMSEGGVGIGVQALVSVCVSLTLSVVGRWRRWLTVDGALAAFPVGVCVCMAGVKPTLMLAMFFVVGSVATKVAAKYSPVKDNDAKVGRNMWQVLATAGVPALICAYAAMTHQTDTHGPWYFAVLAYFSCCCGDTLASELGQLSTQTPRLITTGEKVSVSLSTRQTTKEKNMKKTKQNNIGNNSNKQ